MPYDPENLRASSFGDPNFRLPSDMLDTNFRVPKDIEVPVPKDVVLQLEDARRSTLSETTAEIMNDMGIAPKRALSDKPTTVSLAWNNLSYTITTKKGQLKILDGASGVVRPGEVMAIMGPSGAGKSTLLDVLAGRKDPSKIGGQLMMNGREGNIRHYSTYVMQDDALLGVMTVRENIQFAADLCLSSSLGSSGRRQRVEQIIKDFGLERVADSRIGTVFLRGVSGGEKRRCAIASQVITVPPVIFLDEPTTGLDSSASYHVMKAILEMARSRRIAVIASIHQPSTETFRLFDKLCLIARGRTVYCGSCDGALEHFAGMGYECPTHTNPSDHYLRLINIDFMENKAEAENYVNGFITSYERSESRVRVRDEIEHVLQETMDEKESIYNGQAQALGQFRRYARSPPAQTWIIMKRSFSNSYRNILVFWIRVAMYMCLAMLMGTTWWQTGYDQVAINDRFSAHFFSVAFLVFMSVAGIPAFIEERASFQRERANNFYSVGPYVLANTLVAIPYVFIIAISFDMIAYPMIGLHKGFSHFMNHLMFLFLALIVAESMVVFVAAVIPIFVAALAIVAFMNGFFMVVQGYFVRRQLIPKGWKWAHYIDYQKYAFEAIVKNDFQHLTFNCDKYTAKVNGTDVQQCHCNYGYKSPDVCTFTGQDVLDDYGYTEIKLYEWALALIGLFLIFRVGFYIILRLRRGHH